MDAKVDTYIQSLGSPWKEIITQVRSIIFKTFPTIKEEFKNGVPCYEDKYYVVALKDHVNVGFSIIGLSAADIKLFKGTGKTMKHVEYRSIKDIDENQLINLLKMVKEPVHQSKKNTTQTK
jgi:hypothetical protein